MTVALVLISDGRDCHEQSISSMCAALPMGDFGQVIHVDDAAHELGFAGAIEKAWSQTDADWIVHVECDFLFNRPVPLQRMIDVLEAHPHLVQMALLRQPVNDREIAAGGIIAMDPHLYEQQEWQGEAFLSHRRCVTTNPCVWPRWVVERGWPQRPHSEGHFGIDLFAEDPAYRAAYWGRGEEWVHHIGHRVGRGY